MSQPIHPQASTEAPLTADNGNSFTDDPSAFGTPTSHPWYREEQWLAVAIVSLVVALVAFAVPLALRYPILSASGVLAAISLAMMIRREILLSRESASAAHPEAMVGSTWQPLVAPYDQNDNGKLDPKERRSLPDTAFAFPVQRELPLVDVDHVRAAIGKMAYVKLVSDDDRRLARTNIEAAAAHFGIQIPA